MSNSLRPHGMQHARPPCLLPTLRAYSNSCPLSQWCHPTISSSVVPFSSHLQPFPKSVSFSMSQFFASGGQSIGISVSASILPMNIQDWFPWGWTGWISFLYSPTHTSILDCWKNYSLIRWTFVSKVMSLLFNMLSRLVISFLPRSKCLLISWLQSPYYFSKDLGYIYMESIIFAFFKLLRYNWCITLVGSVQH